MSLHFPATADEDGERAGFVHDLYENFSYVFGKGFYDARDDRSDESMVWYVVKDQPMGKLLRLHKKELLFNGR